MATADVTVMGAGIFGLSIAYICARRGARVRVIDPHGVGAGASGGVVGAMAPHTPERWDQKKAFQFESLIKAEVFWADVEAISGLPSGYGRTGRLQPIADEAALQLARERVAQARELWQGLADWRVRAATDFAGWSPISATDLLIFDTLSARIDPRRACASLARAITKLGGSVTRQGTPINPTVWATGYAGLQDLAKQTGRTVGNGVKGQAALLHFEARAMPQIFTNWVHVVPQDDGTVGIGSTSERYFDDPTSTDADLDDLIERARCAVPALADAPVIARWANVRPRAKTRAPMLGEYPGRPGEFIANGGFKIGFGMAPKIAELMVDLVLDGVDAIPGEFKVEANL